ncbi:hypothetical protein C8Q80DRAFT_436071 [Daedaleopsis nitida]|nr:hypothetical protein C8Q80DRAFT_436071 [Daedaleopsis nitida]
MEEETVARLEQPRLAYKNSRSTTTLLSREGPSSRNNTMTPIHLLPAILLALFAVVGKSLPQDSYYVEVKSDGHEGPSYAWAIGEEEERRISELLDHDIRDLDFVGFNMNTVPKICPHCGKETEIYDWYVSHRPLAVRGTMTSERLMMSSCP